VNVKVKGSGMLKKMQLREVEEHDDKEISLNKPQKYQSLLFTNRCTLYQS